MIRPALVFTSTFLILAAAGCDRGGAASAPTPHMRRVVVVKPTRQDVCRTIAQPATVLAFNHATIYAQVPGYLGMIRVDKGDPVRKRDVIATIDVPEIVAERKRLLAALAQTEAELEATKVSLEREQSTLEAAKAGQKRADADLTLQKSLYDRAALLRKDNVVSVQDLEVAEGAWKESLAALALADAKVREAQAGFREYQARIVVAKTKVDAANADVSLVDAKLDYATIRSPLDGIVTERWVDLGAMIQQATSSASASKIVTIDEIDRVRVDFQVPEKDVAWIASGQPVSLKLDVDVYHDRVFLGTVTRFSGALDEARTMLVEAEYENPKHELRPGMFGEATLETARHKDALTIPAEAVLGGEGEKAIFVVSGGKAHKRAVKIGFDQGPIVEIRKGLAPEDLVVVGGGRLTDDIAVDAVERAVHVEPAAREQEGEQK